MSESPTEPPSRDDAAPPAPPRRAECSSYRLGHTVHVIQWRLSMERPRTAGHVLGVSDDGWIHVGTLDGMRRFWTHDPSRVKGLVDQLGHACEVLSPGLLGFPEVRGDGSVATSMVSVGTEATPCSRSDARPGPRNGITGKDQST